MRYLLTFDIGTTSVKTCLFDEKLRLLTHENEEYTLITGSGNVVELDPEDYWRAVKRGMAQVTAGLENMADIAAVCISTQGETLIPVDREGRALRNAIVWLDKRADAEGEAIAARIDSAAVYEHTGVSAIDGMTPVSKLLWIKNHEPQVYEKTCKFLLLEDYIILRLTGVFASEKVLMTTTAYYDIRRDCLYEDMLRAAQLDADKIPEARDSGSIIANVSAACAAETGLSTSTVVVAGAMDQVAAGIGGGNIRPGVVTETTGTAMIIMTAADEACFANSGGINIYRHVLPGLYYIIPFCITAGVVLKWFKDEFCAEEAALAADTGRNVYDILSEKAAGCRPGAEGLLAVPYFDGMLQPEALPHVRGMFFGASLNTKKPEFIRAIFEGVGYMLRENIELLEGIGIDIREIRSFGGGSNSQVWQQIKSDISKKKISTMEQTECASLGVAILAAVALGWYESLEAAAAVNWCKTSCTPRAENAPVYDAAYERYRKLFQRTKDLF